MAMKSLLDENDRKELVARLDKLAGDRRPQWGKMDCGGMLSHLVGSLQMSTGDMVVAAKPGLMRLALIRYLIIYWLPFPKNVPTAKELMPIANVNIENERATLSKL